jgi:hypothetical protein
MQKNNPASSTSLIGYASLLVIKAVLSMKSDSFLLVLLLLLAVIFLLTYHLLH